MAANDDRVVSDEELDEDLSDGCVGDMVEVIDPALAQKIMKKALGKKYQGNEGTQHPFWDEQPVLKFGEDVQTSDNGPIDKPKTVDDIPSDPYKLHDAFEWYEPDVTDDTEVLNIYTLLYENYVEDDDNMFRFDYSTEFLRWALTPPGFRRDWHLAVRVKKNKKLVGFISAIPAKIRVYDQKVQMVEINFLCVHKKLRSKRLAPLLIKEITRRVNRQNIWQAVYTAGIVLPNVVVSCRYYHRSLNPKKLIDIRFSYLPANTKLSMLQKIYRVPQEPKTPGIRKLELADVPQCCKLLRNYLAKYHLQATFDEKEFAHWFMPREGVINCYVVEDPETKAITDFTSFYTLPSTVLGHPKHKTLKAAYSFYNVANKTPLKQLLYDALILAKQQHFDVFNALDIFENADVFKDLRFVLGDGNLQYYIFNWKCPQTVPKCLGLVML